MLSSKEEDAPWIFFITFKQLLARVGLWGVFESIGQFIVLIIHEVYTDSVSRKTVKAAVEAAILPFAPAESVEPSSSPTESYQPTKPPADFSTPDSTYPTPTPSSGPTITINPTSETMDIATSFPPSSGGTKTAGGSSTPSTTIGSLAVPTQVPTYPTLMPSSSGPTITINPTTTIAASMSPTWGGAQTLYWVPNWHNIDFSEGTCVRKDEWYGRSEALPHFADQVTCCEVAFKDQESHACLREAGELSDEVHWFPDYSVAYSIGTCQNRTGSAQPDMPHFSSQQQCCLIAFANQKPEICLKRIPDYSTSFEGMSDAYKYSKWAFAVSLFMFSARVLG